MTNNETHLTAKALAIRWNLHVRTLEKWRYFGKGPKFLKIEGKVLYRLEDIQNFEQENLCESTANYGGAA